jgi:hypothetical protein
MSGAFERKPGGQGLVGRATADAAIFAPGKQTLTEQLGPGPAGAPRHTATARQVAERDHLNAVITGEGLRFERTGYLDFDPYALTLPNGKKTVRIELTASRDADVALANKAAGLEETPEGYSWHHVEDEGKMILVPRDLHQAVGHTGGMAHYRDRTEMLSYE